VKSTFRTESPFSIDQMTIWAEFGLCRTGPLFAFYLDRRQCVGNQQRRTKPWKESRACSARWTLVSPRPDWLRLSGPSLWHASTPQTCGLGRRLLEWTSELMSSTEKQLGSFCCTLAPDSQI
jgi:hypothetical protein